MENSVSKMWYPNVRVIAAVVICGSTMTTSDSSTTVNGIAAALPCRVVAIASVPAMPVWRTWRLFKSRARTWDLHMSIPHDVPEDDTRQKVAFSRDRDL
jgi:hypothetical protein